MTIQDVVLIAGLFINAIILIQFIKQTRYLAEQTKSLNKSLRYSSYQKLIDYMNEIHILMIENKKIKEIFENMEFMKHSLQQDEDLSVEKVGLAWLIINLYEAAFVGHQLGAMPEEEWDVWEKRLRKDMQLPFIRNVWVQNISNFDYNKKFKELFNDLL
jgi:hypothetical protein